MMTRGSRANSSAWRPADVADPLERAAIGDDEQVVRAACGPDPSGNRSTPGDEVVERRDRVGADGVG